MWPFKKKKPETQDRMAIFTSIPSSLLASALALVASDGASSPVTLARNGAYGDRESGPPWVPFGVAVMNPCRPTMIDVAKGDLKDGSGGGNRTYIVWQTAFTGTDALRVSGTHTSGNKYMCCYYDRDTRTLSPFVDLSGSWAANSSNDDPHGAPCIARDADGYLYVFYGSHTSAQYYRASALPDDITSFGLERTVGGTRNGYTYPQAWVYNGVMHLFMRAHVDTDYYVVCKKGTIAAGVITWGADSANEILFTDPSPYIVTQFDVPTHTFHFMASTGTNAGTTSRVDAYYMKSTDGVTWTDAGGGNTIAVLGVGHSAATIATTGFKIFATYVATEGASSVVGGQFLIDLSGYALFAWVAAVAATGNLKLLFWRWNGSNWFGTAAGTPAVIQDMGATTSFDAQLYQAPVGLCADSPDGMLLRVYLACGAPAGWRGGLLKEYTSTDGGVMWAYSKTLATSGVVNISQSAKPIDAGSPELVLAGGQSGPWEVQLYGRAFVPASRPPDPPANRVRPISAGLKAYDGVAGYNSCKSGDWMGGVTPAVADTSQAGCVVRLDPGAGMGTQVWLIKGLIYHLTFRTKAVGAYANTAVYVGSTAGAYDYGYHANMAALADGVNTVRVVPTATGQAFIVVANGTSGGQQAVHFGDMTLVPVGVAQVSTNATGVYSAPSTTFTADAGTPFASTLVGSWVEVFGYATKGRITAVGGGNNTLVVTGDYHITTGADPASNPKLYVTGPGTDPLVIPWPARVVKAALQLQTVATANTDE